MCVQIQANDEEFTCLENGSDLGKGRAMAEIGWTDRGGDERGETGLRTPEVASQNVKYRGHDGGEHCDPSDRIELMHGRDVLVKVPASHT